MEFTKIPGIDMPVSRVGLGTWAIGGTFWGGSDEADSIKTILKALDSGVNLIDTAPIYGYGFSEEVVGKAIRMHGSRDKVVLATKAGLQWQDGKIRRNASPDRLRQELEDSLKRLRVNMIDLYQVHWPDHGTPLEETAEIMLNFQEEGKVRAIGVSNFSPAEMACFNAVASIQTVQPPYNLFEREMEKDILPWCQTAGVTILGYSALCRGLLSGRVGLGTEFHEGDVRQVDPKFQPPRMNRYLAAVSELDTLAREKFGKRVVHLALRFILDRLKDGVALWGARKPEQLTPLEACFGWVLNPASMDEIDRILKENIPDPIGVDFLSPPE
ncbi:MAG: aldo/keto reductase [Acidobacteria bacterium]|nr:aldo/keto reductase [Acidobacteriota bacterium]